MRFGTWGMCVSVLMAMFIFACNGTAVNPPDGDTTDGDSDIADGDGGVNPDGDQSGDNDLDFTDGDKPDGDADGDPEPQECQYKCLSVTPLLDFGPVPPNQVVKKQILISSIGVADVTVLSVSIATSETSPEYSITGYNPSEPSIVLAPRQNLIVDVTYAPLDLQEDHGRIIVASDDETSPRHDVELTMGYKGNATLTVEPATTIEWGERMANGQSYPQTYKMICTPSPSDANRPLEIQDVSLGLGEESPFELRPEGDCTPPFILAPEQEKVCYVVFKGMEAGEFSDTLNITASDYSVSEQSASVNLTATGVLGRLTIDPSSISFGYVRVGFGPVLRMVTVQNEGTGSLLIQPASWLENAGDSYGVRDDNGVFSSTLEEGAQEIFAVTYEPPSTSTHTGVLAVRSNDPQNPSQEITTAGIGVDECPVAMAPDPANPAQCIPACTPGDHLCTYTVDGWGWQECLDSNGTLGDYNACLEGQICIDGECQDIPCYPGERRCFDLNTEQSCTINGWETKTTCTTEDLCMVSECREGTTGCRKYAAELNSDCDDEDACTQDDHCDGFGNCVGDILDCDDDEACTQDFCDPEFGCVNDGQPFEGDECDDDNPCSSGDTCRSGACVPTTIEMDCNDLNPCTDDFCDPVDGCSYEFNTDPCDDDNVCTVGDICLGGSCMPGTGTLDCDDDNDCTRDFCTPPATGCQHQYQSGYCDDHNSCTLNDYCDTVQGQPKCVAGSVIDCDDHNPCTADSCDENGDCVRTNVLNGTGCSDGSVCTGVGTGATPDQCIDGVCVPGSARVCNDGNVCTTDYCDATGGCVYLANSFECDDGDPCTTGDRCENKFCRAGTGRLDCNDNNVCTIDQCSAAQNGCYYTAASSSVQCNADSNACTVGDHCDNKVCVAGTGTPNCVDTNPCTVDTCDPVAGCKNTIQAGLPCTDNNICTEGDSCAANGACLPGSTRKDCNDSNTCTADSCVDFVGCRNQPTSGASCEDGNLCSVNDSCLNGVCVQSGQSLDCDDHNECTVDSCDPATGCTHTPRTGSCNDGDPCTVNDYCQVNGGTATCMPGNGSLDCNDDNDCTTDSCQAGVGCKNVARNGESCSDGNACTMNDYCVNKTCTPGPTNTCNDNNDCTADSCDPQAGCSNTPITGAPGAPSCTDGNLCTVNDHCDAGECVGSQRDCSDGNVCTDDLCSNERGGCYWDNNAAACNADSNGCTQNDYCSGGTCHAGSQPSCAAQDDQCNVGVCSSTANNSYQCLKDPSPLHGDLCNADSNGCTVHDTCDTGVCKAGSAADCSPVADQCNDAACLSTGPSDFVCQQNPAPHNGQSCNDGTACTTASSCSSGVCVGTANASDGTGCESDNDPCTDDECSGGVCEHNPDPTVWQEPGACPGRPDMVKVLCTNRCIDKYEDLVCRTNDCSDTSNCKGQSSNDYWACWQDNGDDAICITDPKPRACSVAGTLPSRWITFDQAKKACSNSGKYLCPVDVWQSACTQAYSSVYPYGDTYQGSTCNGTDSPGTDQVRNTGSFLGCTNAYGHYDMSGNVWEWSDSGDYSDAKQPIFGGSAFSNSSNLRCAGMIDQTWNSEQNYIGFRCCVTQGP